MRAYRELLQRILDTGYCVDNDRTGVGTLNINGVMLRYDLSAGFPVVTARRTAVKMAQAELIAFMQGATHVDQMGIAKPFWAPWAYSRNDNPHVEAGSLGPIYGSQLRNFNSAGYDQLAKLQETLKTLPYSRRHLLSYFNPLVLPDETLSHDENIEQGRQVLPPCHLLVHVMVRPPKSEGGRKVLDLLLYQRSMDCPVGQPANTVYYATLAHLLAEHADMDVGEFIHTAGCAHIYANQIDGVRAMLQTPVQETLPTFVLLNRRDNIWDYTVDDFHLEGYTPGPSISMPVAV